MSAPTMAAPTARGGALGFFFMVLGIFMVMLDVQIVASSLPEIQVGTSASIDQVTWVQTAYLIGEVVMIPLSGWLARVMSTRWLFSASCAGFTVMSLSCALAWNISSMITFRALQGLMGGAMIPSVLAANYKLFPPERQMLGTVIVGLTATVAPALGPTLGGWITESYTWHWLFLANLAPGIVVTIVVPLLVDVDRPEWTLFDKIDILGIVLIGSFLGSLEIVVDEGPRYDWFETRWITGFAVVSALSAALLFWRELTAENPVLELHAFRNRNFAVGCILAFVLGTCLFGQSFMLPQLLSQVRGYDALQIGKVMFVTGAAMFVSVPAVGWLASKLDPRLVLTAGFMLVVTGLWLNTSMNAEVAFWDLLPPQIARGVGLMLCIVPIMAIALGTLPPELVGGGSAQFNVFVNMGGAVGLALINTLWNSRFHQHYWWTMERLSSSRAAVIDQLQAISQRLADAAGFTGDAHRAALKLLEHQIGLQAGVMAWNDVFLLMAALFAGAAPLVLLLSKPKNANVGVH